MKPLRAIFLFLMILAVMQAFGYYFRVPDLMASHFDSSGHPNGWSSRLSFFVAYLVMTAILGLVFLGLPAVFGRMPTSIISLPNRDYWLAPERRGETVAALQRQMIVFGIATIVLQLVIVQLVINANMSDGEAHLPSGPSYVLLAFYFAFTIVWVYRLITGLRKRAD